MTVRFWRPVMQPRGIIEFLRPEECTYKRVIRPMEIKQFHDHNFSGLEEFTQEEGEA